MISEDPATKGRRFSSEALDGLVFRVEGLENGEELGDGEKVLDLLGEIEELQLAALLVHRAVAANQFAEACRIHVGNLGEIEDELVLAGIDGLVHGIAQGLVAFADHDLALQVDDGHVAYQALDNIHGEYFSFRGFGQEV